MTIWHYYRYDRLPDHESTSTFVLYGSFKPSCIKKSIKADKNGSIYINIRGLYPKCNQSKIPYLSDLTSKTNAPFICLTETHLTPSVLDAEVSISGYDLFRSDRKYRSHGGVAIYVRKDLAVKKISRIQIHSVIHWLSTFHNLI